jgi:hypothetical protein
MKAPQLQKWIANAAALAAASALCTQQTNLLTDWKTSAIRIAANLLR